MLLKAEEKIDGTYFVCRYCGYNELYKPHAHPKVEKSRTYTTLEEIFDELKKLKPHLLKRDKERFTTGFEWEELDGAMNIIFNPDNKFGLDADKRLLIFWMCCILDRQAKVKKVWNNGVLQSVEYIQRTRKNYPKIRFDESENFRKTEKTLRNYDNSFIKWFASKIEKLKPYGEGSLYKFTYEVFNDLLAGSTTTIELQYGKPGLLGEWKRLWMFIMFLRRDKSYIKKLVEEAFSLLPNGKKLAKTWYNDKLFNPIESELPVDNRIKNSFKNIFKIKFTEKEIGRIAHKFGRQEKIPPSTLDVLYLEE